MIDIQKLSVDLLKPENANVSDAAFLATANALNVVEMTDVPMIDVLNFFIQVNPVTQTAIWDKLQNASDNLAYPYILRQAIKRFLVTVQSNIPTLSFELSELVTYLPYVVMLGIITAQDSDDFLNLSRRYHSRAQLDYGGQLTAANVTLGRNYPKTLQLDALDVKCAAAWNALAVVRDEVRAAVLAGSRAVPTSSEFATRFSTEINA